jgi:hypothetical protein
MAQSKKATKAQPAKKRPAKDPRLEEVYEQEVTFMCPKRGKVTQKVKIHRFKPAATNENGKHILLSNDSIDRLEEKDDGLSIYSDGEELGITDDGERD